MDIPRGNMLLRKRIPSPEQPICDQGRNKCFSLNDCGCAEAAALKQQGSAPDCSFPIRARARMSAFLPKQKSRRLKHLLLWKLPLFREAKKGSLFARRQKVDGL